MNNAVILDILLVLFTLLFALIGFWRGVVKEGLAAGGILFGALLADSWSDRFGTIGSNVLNITTNASRFFTIEALLLAVALVVGYGSGSLIVAPVRGIGARLGGAVVGAINAALLLAFSLRASDQFIERSSTRRLLSESHLAHALVVRFNWFLLIVTGVVLVLLFGRLVTERDARTPAPTSDAAWRERRAARLPAPADAGKLEPVARGFDPSTGRYEADAPSLEDLAPIPPASNFEMSQDRVVAFDESGASPTAQGDWRTIRFSHEVTAPVAAGELRCAKCGEVLSDADEFCPLCGQAAKAS